MPTNVTKKWLLGENANAGISGVGSGAPSLGSGSTFSGTANLSSSSTFPTGMMIQIVDNPITTVRTRDVANTLGAFNTPFNVTISN